MWISQKRLTSLLYKYEQRAVARAVNYCNDRNHMRGLDRVHERTELNKQIHNATLIPECDDPKWGGIPVVSVVARIVEHLGLSLRRVHPGIVLEKKGGPEEPCPK